MPGGMNRKSKLAAGLAGQARAYQDEVQSFLDWEDRTPSKILKPRDRQEALEWAYDMATQGHQRAKAANRAQSVENQAAETRRRKAKRKFIE